MPKLDGIREKLKTLPKYEPTFTIEVKDEQGTVIAEVEKLLYLRGRDSASEKTAAPEVGKDQSEALRET